MDEWTPEEIAEALGESVNPDQTVAILTGLNRIAVALEQIALEMAANAPEKAQEPFRAVQQPPALPSLSAPLSAPQGPFAPIGWRCPVHGGSKVVPAGISAKTGMPYHAFVACPERGCYEKPPRVIPQQAGRALP